MPFRNFLYVILLQISLALNIRSDVQGEELLSATVGETTSEVLPITSTTKAVTEAVTGHDVITGERVSRAMALGGIVVGIFPGGKAAVKGGAKGVKAVAGRAKTVAKVEQRAVQTMGKAVPMSPQVPKVHGNSLEYRGKTSVYSLSDSSGKGFKVGESMQGLNPKTGIPVRAEQQVRKLRKQTGQWYEPRLRKTFDSKREAREYETKLIERYRKFTDGTGLPGNKTNR